MVYKNNPGGRLITKNLLTSAALPLRTNKTPWMAEPTWVQIQDLCNLIDIYCLYDEATVFSRDEGTLRQVLDTHNSELIELLVGDQFVKHAGVGDWYAKTSLIETADAHLRAFLGPQNEAHYEELHSLIRRLSPDPEIAAHQGQIGYHFAPDPAENVYAAEQWLRSALATPKRPQLIKQLSKKGAQDNRSRITFLFRTFIYLAYADLSGMVFTPDYARSHVTSTLLKGEEGLRLRLLRAVKQRWEEYPSFIITELQRKVSPFAAVVFERSSGDKKKVVPELLRLREELAPLRKRLMKVENAILNGRRDEVIKAQIKWEAVFDEIQRSYGAEPGLVSLKRVLKFSANIGSLMDGPTSYKGWFEAVLGLPIEAVERFFSRMPAIELHKLRKQLPGSGRLQQSVVKLFGEIR